jgi:thiosulfate dehydrogenase [quinone] large subunit
MMRNAMTIDGREYTRFQTAVLVLLRILVGWHFMYEGLAKIFNPYWTSAGYLAESQWWFSGIFHTIAAHPTLLTVVDYVNAWGLLLIGLGLLFGLFTRTATVAALALLLLYYIAAPPFVGYVYSMPTEGSYLIVNKVLIEMVAVAVLLAFPTGKAYGLDRFIGRPYAGDRTSLHQAGA